MKKFAVSALVLCAIASFSFAPTSHAQIADWQRSATIVPRWNTDFSSTSFQQSVKNLASTHANYVTLHVPLCQSNVNSTDVGTCSNTPTDQSLSDGINFAHSVGLKVDIKFQDLPQDGQWSALINPSDRNTWFKNYGNEVNHYATIAQTDGVEELTLGTELIDMSTPGANSTNTANWDTLIANVRAIFSGKLTYSANWGGGGFNNEAQNVQFWDKLDYIGIAAYFNLTGDGSVAQLESSWDSWNNSVIKPLNAKWGKQVLFTEIGYKSIGDSYTHPWMWWEGGSVDMAAQARDYQALFDYWNNQSFFAGVHLWDWNSDPNFGGSGSVDYSPQNKTAQQTMTTSFSQAGGGGGGGGGQSSNFTASAAITPATPQSGSAASLTITVKNTTAASGDVTDIEIYNSGGSQVFQKFYENQAFAANDTKTYTQSWSPSAAGTYTLKVGMFNSNWTQNYYWGDSVLNINVSDGSGGGGGGGSGTLNIWWPTNGSTVQGVQPFKAMMTNMDPSTYTMYWQVDGGTLNAMGDSSADYPHKEALVDVSGWSWNGGGPYKVNFVAKDLSGNVIAQSPININVQH